MRRFRGYFKISVILVVLLTLAASFDAARAGEGFTVKKQAPRKKAPEFALKDSKGDEVKLDDYGGKVLLLHFWASWCEPCKREFPALQKLRERLKGKGFDVLAIALDSPKRAEPFLKEHGYTLPVVYDQYGEASRLYGVTVMPVSVIIGRTGQIEGLIIGEQDYAGPSSVEYFEGILK